jgi:hypothetical protein
LSELNEHIYGQSFPPIPKYYISPAVGLDSWRTVVEGEFETGEQVLNRGNPGSTINRGVYI